MSTVFVAIDGDNIGQKVGQSVLHDDPSTLAEISQKLTAGLEAVKQWTETHQGQVISLGGDEGVLMFQNIENEDAFLDEIENLRQTYLQTTGATMTVGSGASLSEAGKALLAGKLSGKDMIVPYGEEIEHILHDAHQHVSEGEGSEEEQKQDDHYISHIDGIDGDSDWRDDEMSYEEDQEDVSPDLTDTDMQDQDMQDQDMQDQDMQDQDMQDQDMQDQDMQEDRPYSLHENDDSSTEEDQDFDEGDFDYNPDDYEEQSDELPEEEAAAESEKTMEDIDGGSEEMAGTAPDSGDDSEDEYSTAQEDMQGRVDDVIGSPEEQEDHADEESEEQPIEIPENENMESADEMESEELPMESDEQPQDEDVSAEADAFNEMLSESSHDVVKMKQQVAQALDAFKQQKDQLVAIQDQAPELYEATLGMLQTMLELSKALFGGGEESDQSEETLEDDSEESQNPEIPEGIPDEYMEQEPAPKF